MISKIDDFSRLSVKIEQTRIKNISMWLFSALLCGETKKLYSYSTDTTNRMKILMPKLAFHMKIKYWLNIDSICNNVFLILDLLKILILELKTSSV